MRLAIINDYKKLSGSADWDQLPDDIEIDTFHDRLTDPTAAVARLKPYDIIVTGREETRFDRALIEKLPNLKLFVTHGRRNAALDMDAFKDRDITVCGTGYGFEMGTVELTWALLLSLAKNIPSEYAAVQRGDWGIDLPMGLTGKVLGVAGLGRLGARVARIGLAMKMDVIAWSQNLTQDRCEEIGATLVSKEDLLAKSDFLSIHLVLSERTRGLIGPSEFAQMKSSAYILNTSRGPIIDEPSMIEALNNEVIAGAGLDVFDEEPLPKDHPLRAMPNVLISPHLGGRTKENFVSRYQDCVENVLAWLKQEPVRVLT